MHTLRSPRTRRALHQGLVGLAALALLFACGGSTRQKEETPEALILRSKLLRFSQYYSAALSATADEIADKTDDRQVRELTLRWKLASIPLMHSMVAHEDPRYALIDAWVLCTRQRINFESGPLKDVFGDQQALAVAQTEKLQDRIEEIGRTSLPAQAFDEAEAELEAIARGEPLSGKFNEGLLRASGRISEQAHPGVFSLLTIPIGGLSETAKSISRLAAVGEVFTEVVQELPERTRWETQLFLLEATRTGAFGVALEDFERLSLAVSSMAETARALPAEVRAELEGLLSSTDASMEGARALVADARALVTDTRALLPELEAPLESTRQTSEELTRAGTALTGAGLSVDAAMTTIAHMGDEDPSEADPTPEEAAEKFKVSDLTEAGDSLRGAAVEVRGLLGELESEQTDAAVAASLDAATRRLEQLVDTITLRAIYVVLVLLVGSFLIRRYAPRRRPAA